MHGEPLALRDRAGCMWLLGGLFCAGGSIALALALGFSDDEPAAWVRLAAGAIGVVHLGAGVWLIRKHPAVRATLGADGRLHIERRFPFHGTHRSIARDEIARIITRQGSDSDGDPVWSLELQMHDGEHVPLIYVQHHTREEIDRTIEQLRAWAGGSLVHRVLPAVEPPDG
jgi:hypothetical protein